MRTASLLFGLTVALLAQPPFELQLKDARFGLNLHPFKNFGPASCLEPPERFAQACPANFDCQRTASFRIATTGHGLGPQDLRRFYVIPAAQPDAMRCWGADLSTNDTNDFSAIGFAPFVIKRGAATESGDLPIYVDGSAPVLALAQRCSAWPVGLGSPRSCKVTLQWNHAAHGGNIVGCEWSDEAHGLSHVDGCGAPTPLPPSWTNLSKSKSAELALAARIPWAQWPQAFAVPPTEQPQAVRLKVRYRLAEGGPVSSQEFAVPYQIALPWYLLLGCLLCGTVLGSSLPLAASYARKQPMKLAAWKRTTIAVAIYGIATWLLLYLTESRVGFLQTELRLNQAIPVLLFGLLIGFRGLGFVIDWVEKLLTPNASRVAGALLVLTCGLSAAPRQLLVASGQLFLLNDQGVYRMDRSQSVLQTPVQGPAVSAPVIRFAQGSLTGAAATGAVQFPSGPREILFVSLLLRGGAIVIDEYHPDGTQRENRTFDLRQPGLDFTGAPTALAWDASAQRLYAASPTGTIWAFPRTGAPQRLTASPARISSFAIDERGRRLFVTDTRRGRLLVLDLNAPASGLLAFADDAALADPWSVVYDAASSRLYLADEHRDIVFTLQAPAAPARPLNTRWSQFVGRNHTFLRNYNFGDPVALAIHQQRLWIADKQAGLVFPVDLKTGAQFHPLSPP
jgi:hypothetical protein